MADFEGYLRIFAYAWPVMGKIPLCSQVKAPLSHSLGQIESSVGQPEGPPPVPQQPFDPEPSLGSLLYCVKKCLAAAV
jgi:hypothetical protein